MLPSGAKLLFLSIYLPHLLSFPTFSLLSVKDPVCSYRRLLFLYDIRSESGSWPK